MMADHSEVWLVCHGNHHADPWGPTAAMPLSRIPPGSPQTKPAASAAQKPMPQSADPVSNLQQRLARANAYFRRKAAGVLTDDTAVRLLADLYQHGLIEFERFNSVRHGIPLAKISAAGFCEIGATAIYITLSGERFIGSLIPLDPATDAKPPQ